MEYHHLHIDLDHIVHHDDLAEVRHLDDDFLADDEVDEVEVVDDKIELDVGFGLYL